MLHNVKAKKVHNVFEKISNQYDKMNSVISFRRHKAWREDVMRRMNVAEGTDALDVCTGTGDWALALAKEVGPAGNVVGLDFSNNMLKVAREKQQEIGMNNIEFIQGDAMQLPFEDETFDYVTIGFGLRNVESLHTVLEEMYRVTKKGGKVVCLETSQPTLIGFRQAYYFYFRFVMPLFGKVFAKSYEEYVWLHESAKTFPNKEALKQQFLDVGFQSVDVKAYTFGVAAMHLATK